MPKEKISKNEKENLQEKIKEVFSIQFILNCDVKKNLTIFNDIFLNKQVIKILKNDDIVQTARIFLENDMNLSKASKKWFLHRNTMIYRIDKIKTTLGLNIRSFDDAVRFTNMLEIYKNFS